MTPEQILRRRECERIRHHANRTKVLERQRKRAHERRQLIADSKGPCASCGYYHPYAMDFHHMDPSTKLRNITSMASARTSLDKLRQELGKCVCLCRNCHAILHGLERETGVLPSADFLTAKATR